MREIQLATITTEGATPEALAEYASSQLTILRQESSQMKAITEQAFARAWEIGKACVHLKDNHMPDQEQWELFAQEQIGGGEYHPIYRAMRLYRMSPDRPPGRTSAAAKQLLIMFGDEAAPKGTPRKGDARRFINFKAATAVIQRWWRSGDVIQGLTDEELREILDDLAPLVAIHESVKSTLEDNAAA